MSRPDRGGASLRAVLALPRARGLLIAGALARLPYGLHPLPLLLTLRAAGGSFAAAGTAVGVYSLISALLIPFRARLVERRPATLPWLAGAFALLLATVAGLAAVHAGWVAVCLAPLAGLLCPPVGPLVRARWGVLARTDHERQAALSLDAVSESTIFALAPAPAGLLLALLGGPAALGVCAACFALGFLALAAVLRHVPAPSGPTSAETVATQTPAATPAPARVPLRSVTFLSVLLAVAAVGMAAAMAELAVIAAWGAGVGGPLLALYSVGGALGGLSYGRRVWRRSAHARLSLLVAGSTVALGLCALLFAPGGAAVGLFLAGAATDCVLITAYLLVEELVPAGARTEGGAWVNTAFNLGVAGGSGLAGALTALTGPREVLVVAALLALAVSAPLALGGLRWRRSQQVAGSATPPATPSVTRRTLTEVSQEA